MKDLQRPPEDMATIGEGCHEVTVFGKEYYEAKIAVGV
jgi:hypothetical protein